MPISGRHGAVEFSREWPKPVVLSGSVFSVENTTGIIDAKLSGYWVGDRVIFTPEDGSPVDTDGDALANTVNGFGMYAGSAYQRGPRRSHVLSNDTAFYRSVDTVFVYDQTQLNGEQTFSGYIGRDILGRIKLYKTESAAHIEDADEEYTFYNTRTGNILIIPYSDQEGYAEALPGVLSSALKIMPSDRERTIDSGVVLPSVITDSYNSTLQRGWEFTANTENWALELNSNSLDMTAIGECFGEYTKAVVEGAGQMQFFIERSRFENISPSQFLLHLVLMTQSQGFKADARFYVYKDLEDRPCADDYSTLSYWCKIMISGVRLTVEPDNLVRGSADFVVIGEPKLNLRGVDS